MGFMDWLRRRPSDPAEASQVTAGVRAEDTGGASERDDVDEPAHEHRDENVYREPRKPPGTG